ncbi:MAG: DoxX family protein [Deltaproteobacteria bacterium]|jgi:hypothetical protein
MTTNLTPTFRDRAIVAALAVTQLAMALGEAVPLDEVAGSFDQTRLPRSLLPWLVLTKVAAAAALVLPLPRWLKEWAFAGILIDHLGAGASYLLAGAFEAFGLKMVPPALLLWAAAFLAFRRNTGPLAPEPTLARGAHVATLALAASMVVAAAGELLRVQPVMTSMEVVRVPVYVLSILAPAKLLAALALVVPGYPTLRLWARAGLAFNFAGALFLYAAEGTVLLPDVPLLLVFGALVAYTQASALGAGVVVEPRLGGRATR